MAHFYCRLFMNKNKGKTEWS